MFATIRRVFPGKNERELRSLSKIVQQINKINLISYTDDELKNQTIKLKKAISEGNSLEAILPEAFATVKEASKRVLGMTHYDVQLMGGVVLHHGNVSEMKTGEGKTLVGTLPAYLNALTEKAVHIVTVNEYLAKRDFEELSPLFDFLGISSSYIYSDMSLEEKKVAYQSSIVFGTNNEFGFDYLRDNMVHSLDYRVQSELNYAIIDEVDSILIDEARTPLVISGPSSTSPNIFKSTNALVLMYKKGRDYDVDNESQQCFLTEEGINKAEKFFSIDNLYAPEHSKINHFLSQSLRAHAIMKKDKDYIVSEGEVHIIDPFTGRLSKGRRYSNGLHQAIEVKEGVDAKQETVTKATITYQNYFRMYKKIAGMTGTAETEKEELLQVYGMDTVVIPTNKPIVREDTADLIFLTNQEKKQAIVEKVKELHKKEQPVLIGTSTIEESEEYHEAFLKEGIPHVVLNAKNHQNEAEIVSQAGQKCAVTIATNMAGRGTDIKLGAGVQELGGLYIIGTSKNENRRVDNQLRGRSGRQGDPGFSQFYVSLEDELMIRFGASKIKGAMERLKISDEGLSSPFLTRIFQNAQKQLEGANYDIRKKLLQYDNVLNKQREIVYKERTKILSEKDITTILNGIIEDGVTQIVSEYVSDDLLTEDWNTTSLHDKLLEILRKEITPPTFVQEAKAKDIMIHYIDICKKEVEAKKTELPIEIANALFKNTILSVLDMLWEQHLDNLSELRQGIHLRAYAQTDPLREYEFSAMDAFEEMLQRFMLNSITYIFGIQLNQRKEVI